MVQGALYDITKRKKAEDALLESEEKYRLLFEAESDAIMVFDAESKKFMDVNNAAQKLYGFSYEEFLNMKFHDISAEPEESEKSFRETLAGKLSRIPLRYHVKKDTTVFPVEISAGTFTLRGRQLIIGAIRDITERKVAEEELQFRSEFENLITNISKNFINLPPDSIDNEITHTLQEIGEFVGIDRSYIFQFYDNGKKMDNTHEWCAEGIEPHIQRLKGLPVQEFTWSTENLKKGGTLYVPCVADLPPEAHTEKEEFKKEGIQSLVCVPMSHREKVIGFVGFDAVHDEKTWSEDILALLRIVGDIFANALKHKHAEEQLRESEEKYRLLFEAESDAIMVFDAESKKFIDVNKAAIKLYGFNHEEFLNMKFHDISADPEESEKATREALAGKLSHIPLRYHVKKDRTVFPVEISAGTFTLRGRQIVIGAIRDITERKQAEKALKKSEEKIQSIFRAAPTGIGLVSSKREFLQVNNRFCEMLGYTSDELIGKSSRTIYPSDEEFESVGKEKYKQIKKFGTGTVETKFIRKDGRIIDVLLSSTPIDPKNLSFGVTFTALDITDRKKSEEALRESEERLKVLFENAPDAYYLIDLQGTFIDGNKVAEEITGYKKEELIGHSFLNLDLLSPYQLPKAVENLGKNAMGLSTGPDEYILKRKNDTLVPIEIHTSPIRFKGETIVMGIARDITVRKRSEEALRESERRFRTLVENSPMGIWQDDIEQKTIYINQAMLNLLEVESPEDTYGHNWKSFFTTEGLETIARETEKRSSGISSNYELDLIGKRGTKRSAIVYGSPLVSSDGITKGTIATFLDITDRKEMEDALRESEQKYRELVETSINMIFILDRNGNFLFTNKEWDRRMGYSKDEEKPNGFELIHPDSLDNLKIRFADIIEGSTVENVEFISKTKSGSHINVLMNAVPVFDSQKHVVAALGVAVDITDRKQTEERLILLKEAIEALPLGITISSTAQEIFYVNPAEAKMHGYEVEEVIGKDARIFAPQDYWRPMTFDEIHEMGIWKRESINIRKNGETFPVELTSIAVKDASGSPIGIIIASEDITERKRSEKELIRAEKLESLSVLASGIAHDFNNMLTIILTSIALAKHYAKENVKASLKLQETEKEILLAKELTNQLLTFSKGGAPVKKLASISELLHDVTSFSLKGSDHLCEFHIADDLWAAEIDSGQVSQVISNIVINAKQSMPERGVIKVSADNIAVDKENNLPIPDGNYVKISIQDQGTGIPEEHIRKIFDPFFTTKEGGTGLGLSTSYSIIKNHQGYINVESDMGVGTTFDIYLPASTEQQVIYDAIIEKHVRMHWRLLLMEDDVKIRENVTELLTTVGYDVETAREGNEAIQLYKNALQSHRPFHAVIMDLTISGGRGAIECISELTTIDPDIKAILMSGYTSSPEMAQFKEYGFKGVIYKPFNIEEVDKTLQEILIDKGE
jgi:PAS domain S-box-containing protein